MCLVITIKDLLPCRCRATALTPLLLDGVVRVGDVVEAHPPCTSKPNKKGLADIKPLWGHAKVLEIRFLGMAKQYALPKYVLVMS